jgi:Raf kinase inhibitor-like YbhB/YbcL family protein
MHLASSAFADGASIPRRYTRDAEDLSPPLHWRDPPPGTRSFVLICDDPDAPGGTWAHWAVYDIPPERTALPEGAAQRSGPEKLQQAINDFKRRGYGGPCPPHGRAHHYRFRLLALSVAALGLHGNPSCREVEHQARSHVLAEAGLVGLYRR